MFKLSPNPTFEAKCPITIAGQEKPAILTVVFKHKTRDWLKDWFKSLEETDANEPKDDVLILMEIMESWKDADSEFSEEALRKFLQDFPASGMEIFECYKREAMESRAKNSERLRAR
jgi:hypothetical protein